jgi:hypothetical protein
MSAPTPVWLATLAKLNPAISRSRLQGQAYNLNIAVSGILVPDGRCNRHISPKCYTRQLFVHHICGSFYSSLKLKFSHSPFLSLQKFPQTCLNRIRRSATGVT